MERDIILNWADSKKIDISSEKIDKLCHFANLIHETNQKFNVTGFKTIDEIMSELIIRSIEPVCDIIVPRGTRLADLGSGSGIPGIVISICNNNYSGILIESNSKKAEFLNEAIAVLGIQGLKTECSRAEDIAKNPLYRESFDWCFSRAFGKMYIALELGAPLIKKDGFMYIYSNERPEGLSESMKQHTDNLGLSIIQYDEFDDLKISKEGLCFKKNRNTPDRYPRRYAIIKRDAENIIN